MAGPQSANDPLTHQTARVRERIALAVCLAVATVVVETWPHLDLLAAAAFFSAGRFEGDQWTWVRWSYLGVPRVGGLLVAGALLVLLARWLWPARVARPLARRAGHFILVVVLGVGLLVHDVLKDNWGRPRPQQVNAFGGPHEFKPPLHHSDLCRRNCSFVSGHAAAGFALIAIGAYGTRRTRWRWWAIGALVGGLIGLGRVMQGSHFASDIVFCLLAIWAVSCLLREAGLRLALRRRRRRARRTPQEVLPA